MTKTIPTLIGLALIGLMLLPLPADAAQKIHSMAEMKQVMLDVKAQFPPLKNITVRLGVDPSDRGYNAQATYMGGSVGYLTVTGGMMDHLRLADKSEAAALFGHELSHMAHLDGTKRDGYCNVHSYVCEKQADFAGKQAAISAGYDCEGAANLFRFFLEAAGNYGGDTHPATIDRIAYLTCRGK